MSSIAKQVLGIASGLICVNSVQLGLLVYPDHCLVSHFYLLDAILCVAILATYQHFEMVLIFLLVTYMYKIQPISSYLKVLLLS